MDLKLLIVVICFQTFNNLVLSQQKGVDVYSATVVICFQTFNNLVLSQPTLEKCLHRGGCDLLSNF